MTTEAIAKPLIKKLNLPVDENHCFFWVQHEYLHETYNTIRGRRFRVVMPLPGLPDMEHVTEDQLNVICGVYLVQCDNCTSFFLPEDRSNEVGSQFRFAPNLCHDCICKQNEV